MEVKIKSNGIQIPAYATTNSAGMDIRANIEEEIFIQPMERVIVPTGIFMALPEGYEAQIRPRSGLAAKYGITVLNTPGTIDADYRGEVGVILINLSDKAFKVQNGDRIAQMVISKYEQCTFKEVDELEDTERGAGGFGHSGKK